MKTATTERTAEQTFIDPVYLDRASADPERVHSELQKWKADPERYIEQNYARLVEYDFPVYAAGNIRIQDKVGRAVNLQFNRIQRQLWRWFLEDLTSGRPIRWYIIKARQMGVSTWVLALFYWLCSLRANRNALIVAHDEASTTNFNSRIRSAHSESHPLLKSETVTDRRDLVHFGNKTSQRKKGTGAGLDSRLVFSTAQRGELGRSYNFHAVLLSEFAIWPELGIDIEATLVALAQTIGEYPGTVIILESTAKGANAAARIWGDKTNEFRKIFIPWCGFDDYRKPLKPGESLGELCASDEAGGRDTRYGNEIEESRLIRDALLTWYPDEVLAGGEEWIKAEVDARLNWRRGTIDKKCLGDLTAFRREYPTCAAHAFASTSKNCFDVGSLELMRKHVEEEDIKCRRFSYNHDPDVNDANVKFQLHPFGPLYVYKLPEIGQNYVIGGDVAQGIPNSGDYSSLIVLAVPDLEEVASFNQIITPDQFAELAHYLGLIYNGALLGLENNERGGFTANTILARQLHYPRLFYRFDAFDKKAAGQPGYVTTDTRKSVTVTELAKAIRDHEILLRTPQLLDQLAHYMLLNNGTMGAPPSWNDDLVSALLIAVHLSTKVHLYAPVQSQSPRGSFNWHARKHAERSRPGYFGYKR